MQGGQTKSCFSQCRFAFYSIVIYFILFSLCRFAFYSIILVFLFRHCSHCWLLLQGIRKFGKNFSAIASILGTKTESHVRSFFVNYRRRYDLDLAYKVDSYYYWFINGQKILYLCQEYEAEFGPSEQSEGGDKEEAEVFVFYALLELSC